MAVNVLCLLVRWVGLQSMVVAFPGHIHVLFSSYIFLCVRRVILYEIRGLNIKAPFKNKIVKKYILVHVYLNFT